MEFINKIQNFIEKLDKKEFSIYIGSILGVVLILISFILFNHYRTLNNLQRKISNINEEREATQKVIEKSQYVKKQQETVNAILAQDENFKISGYFQGVLSGLGLENKKGMEQVTSNPRADGNYTETILTAQFSGMNMKQLCELLRKIEEKKRIYSKNLEVTRSKKTPQSLDVSLTIATLQPQATATE